MCQTNMQYFRNVDSSTLEQNYFPLRSWTVPPNICFNLDGALGPRVRISGERGPFRKSTIKSGLKKCFRYRNPQIGTAGPDSTRYSVNIK